MRFGHTQLRLDVRAAAGETTHARVAALLNVPPARLTLLSAGRVIHTEAEARAARAILALGTPAGAQLPSAWQTRLRRGFAALRGAPAALPRPAALLHAVRFVLAALWAALLSLLLPSHAPPP